jgi:hypothetical protein
MRASNESRRIELADLEVTRSTEVLGRGRALQTAPIVIRRSWLSDAWDTVTGWIDSVRQWFLRTFGGFWGGLLFGILSALVIVVIGIAIGWAVGAIVGAFIASATVAAIVTAVILIGGAIVIAVYARFQEFYADNPGQSAGFWPGLGLVGLGIADITGIRTWSRASSASVRSARR